MLDGRLRATVSRGLTPIGRGLERAGVGPDGLTALGLALSVVTALLIASGHLVWGVVALTASGLVDLLDGSVARTSGRASPRGAFFDSVADRFTDALLLGGVAWYLASTQPGRIAVLPFAVLALSMLISYERAKADSLGYDARGGLMERAERLIALGFGLLFDSLLVPVLWVMLVLTAITAVQRFVRVWRQASAPRPVPATTRWRTRRAARTTLRVKVRGVRRLRR